MKSKWSTVALVLLIIGGLNWGCVGLWHSDLISLVFGEMSLLSRAIYLMISAAAVYKLIRLWKQYCPRRSCNPIQ